MNLDKLTVGKNPPEEINVAIEIPAGSSPVKYAGQGFRCASG